MWYCRIVNGTINCFTNSETADADMIPLPEGVDPTNVQVVMAEDGSVTLTEDPAKVQAKTQAQWVSVRAQQSDLLYKSDWTCSVIDPPAPILAQRDQWVAYRQALRDVTRGYAPSGTEGSLVQSDPFNITWPPRPSA